MIRFSFNKGIAVVFGVLFFGVSCGDKDIFDTDKWSDKIEGWTPSITGAIGHGQFSLWDLLEDSDENSPIQREPIEPGSKDSMLVIKYLKEDIYKQDNLSEIFRLPLEPVSLPLPGVEIPGDGLLPDFTVPEGGIILSGTSARTPLGGIPAGSELTEIMFSAKLNVKFPRLLNCDYRLTVEFDNLYENTNDGSTLKRDFVIVQGAGEQLESINLVDALVKLTADEEIGVLITGIQLLVGGSVDPGSMINGMSVELTDLVFTKATGRIIIDPMQVEGDFDMDVDFLNELGGTFQFSEPQLNLIVNNKGIGVKTGLKLSFWVNEGEGKDRFDGKELTMYGNKENDDFKSEPVGYNKNDEGLVSFLSLPPKGKIYYNGTISSAGNNGDVIWSDGAIRMDAEVKIPLKLKAEKLSYCDTLKDIDIDSDITDKLVSGVIKISVRKNELPLSLKISQLQLVDKDGQKLSVVKGQKSIPAYSSETITLELSDANIKDLGKTKNILMQIEASTDGKEAILLSSAKLDFILSVEAKADIKDTNF